MQSRQLLDLLSGRIEAATFEAVVGDEVAQYRDRCSLKGASVPVALTAAQSRIVVTPRELKSLLHLYLSGGIGSWSLRYIAEALVLSHYAEQNDIPDESIRETLETLSDISLDDEELTRIAQSALDGLT